MARHRTTRILFLQVHQDGAMLLFDLSLFDEAGRRSQQIALEADSHEKAHDQARTLQKTHRAATHVLTPVVRARHFVPPSPSEIEAHHRLLQARDQLRR